MLSLLRIEWLKIKKYPAFWWMLGIVALTYPGVNLISYNIYTTVTHGKEVTNDIAKMLLGNPYAFPETWHTVAYFSSYFVLLPSILIIMLITNEYQFRTHRQNIIDGWSRNQFMTGKLLGVFIVATIVTVVCFLVACGFGFTVDSLNTYRWSDQLQYIPLFFLQTFSQLSIAFLLGYLIKRSFIALGIFVFYYFVVENILVGYLKYKLKVDEIARFLPFEVSDRALIAPSFVGRWGKDGKHSYEQALQAVPTQVLFTVLLTVLIWLLCYSVHRKRDL